MIFLSLSWGDSRCGSWGVLKIKYPSKYNPNFASILMLMNGVLVGVLVGILRGSKLDQLEGQLEQNTLNNPPSRLITSNQVTQRVSLCVFNFGMIFFIFEE
ncbi:MAG: hypothetical protein JW702_01770 [Clostridiales bacterium]|nr:hypothetical protein [Clostridiales bacterium]